MNEPTGSHNPVTQRGPSGDYQDVSEGNAHVDIQNDYKSDVFYQEYFALGSEILTELKILNRYMSLGFDVELDENGGEC